MVDKSRPQRGRHEPPLRYSRRNSCGYVSRIIRAVVMAGRVLLPGIWRDPDRVRRRFLGQAPLPETSAMTAYSIPGRIEGSAPEPDNVAGADETGQPFD